MANSATNGAGPQPRRGFKQVLSSYFYWTYPRGSFHYDVMVTLILAFIFITPHLWDFGAKPSLVAGPVHPMQVVGNGIGVIVTVQSLGSYLTRIRRKELAKPVAPTPPAGQTSAEMALPLPNAPAKSRDAATRKPRFEYPPGPPDESKLI